MRGLFLKIFAIFWLAQSLIFIISTTLILREHFPGPAWTDAFDATLKHIPPPSPYTTSKLLTAATASAPALHASNPPAPPSSPATDSFFAAPPPPQPSPRSPRRFPITSTAAPFTASPSG